jgi:thiamine kinase-like enzyme
VPAYYGSFQDDDGQTWLVLEYLEAGVPIEIAPDPTQAIASAAQWMARFHVDQQRRLETGVPSWLDRLDADHYRKCALQTAEFAADLRAELPWLRVACQRFEREFVELLAVQPTTIIHGDYFTDNILFQNGTIYAIDWEWSALGPGYVDIARLTEQWPSDLASRWEFVYGQTRWPEGLPPDYNLMLKAVRVYLCFRYLAIAPDRIRDPKRRWRLETIRSITDMERQF